VARCLRSHASSQAQPQNDKDKPAVKPETSLENWFEIANNVGGNRNAWMEVYTSFLIHLPHISRNVVLDIAHAFREISA